MTLSAQGYTGPSPAAKQFTVAGTTCAIDVWCQQSSGGIYLLVVEKLSDGTWDYLGRNVNTGYAWVLYCLGAPLGLGSNQSYTVPGQTPISGNFAQIVQQAGASGMVWPWLATITNWINARFASGPSPAPSPDIRNAEEIAAQQSIAGAINSLTVTVNGNAVSITHP